MIESEVSLMVRNRCFVNYLYLPTVDDLPVIRDNIKKGFLETQTRMNSFFTTIKKKFEESSDDEEPPPPPPRKGQQYGRGSTEYGRKSADHDRYDADPELIGDDFTGLRLHDEEARKSVLNVLSLLLNGQKLQPNARTGRWQILIFSNLHQSAKYRSRTVAKIPTISTTPHQILPKDRHRRGVKVSGSLLLLWTRIQCKNTIRSVLVTATKRNRKRRT